MSLTVYHAVLEARITPASLKFVTAVLALCAGDHDGGEIYPSLATLASYCSISRDQARRHVQALTRTGILAVVKPATPRTSTRYRMDLQRLAELPRATGATAERGSTHATPGVAPMPPQGSRPCPLRGSTHATLSPLKALKGFQGEAAAFADAGLAPGAAAASLGVDLPPGLDPTLFADLVANGKATRGRVRQLIVEAQALAAGGDDLNELCRQAIAMGWARWPRATAVPKAGRSKGSKPKASSATRPMNYGMEV